MQNVISGKAFVYGTNISTDQIYPGQYLDLTDPDKVAEHALQGADPSFVKEVKPGDIVVAAANFGCGSSREQAATALQTVGVGAILADSFGRIFYRNAINLGVPLLVCPGITDMVKRGDVLKIDLTSGEVKNETTGKVTKAQPLSPYVMEILENGGIKPMIKKQYGQ